jgi:hypothetical protein
MRFSLVSLSVFLTASSAFAAGLPVVNIAAGGVSARSAFGDDLTARGAVTVSPARRVVSRAKNGSDAGVKYNAKQSGDVLNPNLPSTNLWADGANQMDTPLRMPRFDEVAILDSNYELPAEEIDINYTAHNDTPVTRGQVARELESTMNRMAEIDAQIAKLSELQRRANDSVKSRTMRKTVAVDDVNDDVAVSRTIVPIDEPDVLVRSVEKHHVESKPKDSLADLSPTELRRAFRKTFLSENKHLSAMRDVNAAEYDTRETVTTARAGFTAESNLSEMGSGIRPFEIKISFRDFDSALSRENYTLLTTFAGIVVNDPKRAVQVLIPNDATTDSDTRKLTARRLAIVEQVLRDTGVPEQRILPMLSNRDDDGGLVLRNIDNTQYETLTKQQRDKFGKTTNKTYKSMTW